MSLTGNRHPFVTLGSRVSRAPPRHTLPAFLNLHGGKIFTCEKKVICYKYNIEIEKHICYHPWPIQARTRNLSTGEYVQKWTRYFLLFFLTVNLRKILQYNRIVKIWSWKIFNKLSRNHAKLSPGFSQRNKEEMLPQVKSVIEHLVKMLKKRNGRPVGAFTVGGKFSMGIGLS